MRTLALALLLGVALLAGCGGSSKSSTSTTTTAAAPDPAAAMRRLIAADPAIAGSVTTLFQESRWAVVQSIAPGKANTVVFRLVKGKWVPDRSGDVKVTVLGPQPGAVAPALPQVAIEVKAQRPLVDTGLWVDGTELATKGGGSLTEGTVYGAPAKRLKPGEHVAVGYGRTSAAGTARAWVFRVG